MISKKREMLKKRLISVFYPERCPYCKCVISLGQDACEKCRDKMPSNGYTKYARGGFLTIGSLPYAPPYSDAVCKFKFSGVKQSSYPFAITMTKTFRMHFSDIHFDAITYVPLHKEKLSERGFNQSELLAHELSLILDIPLENALKKTRKNRPQHELGKKQRKANVKGVFKIADKIPVKAKTYLLVDDIFTTGCTLGECASVLLSNGAKDVFCITFAVTEEKFLEMQSQL